MMNFIKAWLGKKADSQTFAFAHSPNFDGIPVEVAPSEYGGEHPCEILEMTSYIQTLTVEGPLQRLGEFRKSVSRRGAVFGRLGGTVHLIAVPIRDRVYGDEPWPNLLF
jgi:hypothetical protein